MKAPRFVDDGREEQKAERSADIYIYISTLLFSCSIFHGKRSNSRANSRWLVEDQLRQLIKSF